jgi:radical SAM protein with 4Fe4S-binding SPASM domain
MRPVGFAAETLRSGLIDRARQAISRSDYRQAEEILHRQAGRLSDLGPYFFGKWMYHPDRRERFFAGDVYGVMPVTVEFVPSLECSFACPHCTYGGWKDRLLTEEGRAQLLMDAEAGGIILRKLAGAGVKAAIFTGGGEPLAHSDLIGLMLEAKQLGMETGLFTNGLLLSDELAGRVLREVAPAFLRVSLNAGDADTHRRFHGYTAEGVFDRVVKNLEALARLRKQIDQLKTTVAVGNIVDAKNVEGLPALAELLRRISDENGPFDYVSFRPVVNYGGRNAVQSSPQVLRRAQILIEGWVESRLVPGPMQVINVQERFEHVGAPDRGFRYCLAHPWRVSVAPDGGVYLCAEHNGDPRFFMGNLLVQEFDEIWFGTRRRELIRRLNDGLHDEACPPICVLSYMNRAFAQFPIPVPDNLLPTMEEFFAVLSSGESPQHVNFL